MFSYHEQEMRRELYSPHKALNSFDKLHELIEEQLSIACTELDNNSVSSRDDINKIKKEINNIFFAIRYQYISESFGIDSELKPYYLIAQGIIENAIAQYKRIYDVDAYVVIIAPRMPSPLVVKSGLNLGEIDATDPLSYIKFRNTSLENYLSSGSNLYAVYSSTSRTDLLGGSVHSPPSTLLYDAEILANYNRICLLHKNLIDAPILKFNVNKFPTHLTGTYYSIDNSPITVETKQVIKDVNSNTQYWAIKFGNRALPKVHEINELIKNNSDETYVRIPNYYS